MAVTVAKYSFSSWLRKGIAANINEPDNLGVGSTSVQERATIQVDVSVNAQAVIKQFSLLGPGDIVGINPNLIVRTEPVNWITDYEPNYFPLIEFYDEDFAWRYTPAKANGDKLRPWIALIVLKESDNEDEQEFTLKSKQMPLPTVTVKSANSLPPHTQTWAWSHVHMNEGHVDDSAFEKFLTSLHDLDHPNSDKIISRLICPRKLEPNKAYRAFVVPAFETGRLAGLGLDTSTVDAQKPSWSDTSDGVEFPVYYDWYFRTGKEEDFESLVKLLEPRIMDSRVGIRDMDGSEPGFGMTEGTDIGAIFPATNNQEIIGLEGALKAPSTVSRPETIDKTKPYFTKLQSILNLPAEIAKASNNTSDPMVCPPIYGENHLERFEIDIQNNGWLNHLNRDPRLRVPSGFGTSVIQKSQEDYLARAWQQVQKILDANRKIKLTKFAMMFAVQIKMNVVDKVSTAKLISLYGPVLTKVKGSPTTLHAQIKESNLPIAAVSAPFRRMLRPRGVFYKKLRQADSHFGTEKLFDDLNSGKISPAPPRVTPAGLDTVSAATPGALPDFVQWILDHWLLFLLIGLALVIVLAILGMVFIAVLLGIATLAMLAYAQYLSRSMTPNVDITNTADVAQTLRTAPSKPTFRLIETDPVITSNDMLPGSPANTTIGNTEIALASKTSATTSYGYSFNTVSYQTLTRDGEDTVEASNFRKAAIRLNSRLAIRTETKERLPFDFANAKAKLSKAIDPKVAFPKQLASLVYLSFNPTLLLSPEKLNAADAYPDFEDPMYEKLRDISSELLLPNLQLIPPNTISLLVTNPEFIESYMVGLNHELGRELLWREYPTDKRGSYFRQFWDVKGITSNESNLSREELVEKYKDITPIDTWTSISQLGTHNNRNTTGEKKVVLVVRGDLLKKYPNTIIYAQKANAYKNSNGQVDATKQPVIVEVQTEQQMADEIKFPMFKAEINPDYKFFGFDLTIEQARGDADPKTAADDWGYYFIIQQIPGEPRFGMDITYEPDDDPSTPITWDDMSWDKYDNTELFVKTNVLPNPSFQPGGAGESRSQWGSNAAAMAYILYQKPVMIAVHAKEMLQSL